MFSNGGFTLIEVLVGAVIGALLVVAVGVLGQNVVHQRISADSNSAAMSIAEKKVEGFIYSAPVQGTTTENVGPGGLFHAISEITDDKPMDGMKKVHVSVTHNNNPYVNAEIYTYLNP